MANGIMGLDKLDQLRMMQQQGGAPMSSGMPMGGEAPAPMAMNNSPSLMQDMAPEMMQRENMVDTDDDAVKLASAVVGRSQGNPQVALDILDKAKAVVLQQIGMADGGELMGYADGNEISKDDLNPGLQALAKNNKDVVEKITGKTVKDMAGGGPMMPMYNLGGDIEKIEKMEDGGQVEAMERMNFYRGY
jgi:hypothetical protein|tara:strand:+ start:180 stop:749 length:570 start_codon:yes stop_codon:yes gene_type:complete